jgi:multidrug efflux pump subunit AcrA (membrane-fusion protein)
MIKHLFLLLFVVAATVAVAEPNAPPDVPKLVCVGRVEPVDGEVEVSAQMSGTLIAVSAKEGDWVTKGAVLAEVDAPREKTALDLALAKLARVKAGNGVEEIAASEAARDAVAAELELAETEYQRAVKLREQRAESDQYLDEHRQRASALGKQLASVTKQAEAMKRGPIPEEVHFAEAEVTAARASYELRLVRAQSDGAILNLYRHTGDFVTLYQPSPILRMADTKRLRVRIEVNEQEAHRVKEGMVGEFTVLGMKEVGGGLVMKMVLPSFAPRRLFEPDSNARLDTRTLNVLCEFQGNPPRVFSGQRVMATFPLTGK